MPKKNTKKEENVVVIEKPKRGRKKKVKEPKPASPMVDSQPAPVSAPKKRGRKKKVVTPVVVEEVKVDEVKPKKTKKSTKVSTKDEPKKKRPKSKWMVHVAEFRKKNPDMKYSDVLKNAKATYTK